MTAVRTNTVRNAPERPTAPPITPVARPLRPAYHFCAQDWMDGYRNAVPSPAGMLNARKKLPALPPGRIAAAKNTAAQQCCSPQSRTPRASAVLQKAAEDAPHAERRNEDAEGIACPLLAQAILVHDRLLEHAPRRRKPREHLNGGPGGKDRPRVFCCKLLFHRFTSKSVQFAIVCPFGLTIRQFPL